MADGHKWMLGPEGLALLWVRPQWRERLTLYQYGWHMTRQAGDFDAADWQPADDARRFECGSPNLLGAHGLEASLSLLEEYGMQGVQADLLERSAYLIERISAAPGLELLSDPRAERRSGIVTFRHRGIDNAAAAPPPDAMPAWCARSAAAACACRRISIRRCQQLDAALAVVLT